jgi:hypothetical protein
MDDLKQTCIRDKNRINSSLLLGEIKALEEAKDILDVEYYELLDKYVKEIKSKLYDIEDNICLYYFRNKKDDLIVKIIHK